mmetsp:Transcript_21892/g.53496  ORF Transcript_21892/g.53496 Transcript_21892/m.53496 type:complete len:233 (-) Transcript_21892:165-863(-)
MDATARLSTVRPVGFFEDERKRMIQTYSRRGHDGDDHVSSPSNSNITFEGNNDQFANRFNPTRQSLPPISEVIGSTTTDVATEIKGAKESEKPLVPVCGDESVMRLDNLIDPPDRPPSLSRVSCPICGSSFKKRANLKRHVQTVHARQKDFKCPVCISSFSQKAHRDRHIRTVHGQEKKHSCHICGKSFTLRFSLDRHAQRFHSQKSVWDSPPPPSKRQFSDPMPLAGQATM